MSPVPDTAGREGKVAVSIRMTFSGPFRQVQISFNSYSLGVGEYHICHVINALSKYFL